MATTDDFSMATAQGRQADSLLLWILVWSELAVFGALLVAFMVLTMMDMEGAALFLIVWLFRTVFSKSLSPQLKYALWFLVVLRLCIPITLESGLHLFTLPAQTQSTALPQTQPSGAQTAPALPQEPLLDGGASP